jgi:hypothetical protein
MNQIKMKKILIIFLAILAVAFASAVTLRRTPKAPKVPEVTENVNIPYFIDTFMTRQRISVSDLTDSNNVESRLIKLGFTSKGGSSLDPLTAQAVEVLFDVYDSIYPRHQFVNYKCVYEIMKNYGLSIGTTDAFICDIPLSRIDSMENFKVSYIYDRPNHYPLHDMIHSMEEMASTGGGFGNLSGFVIDTYYPITSGDGALGKEKDLVKYSMIDMVKRPLKSTTFFVLAPASCFNVEANSAGNHAPVKDPIILAPVEGGYIIVTAW